MLTFTLKQLIAHYQLQYLKFLSYCIFQHLESNPCMPVTSGLCGQPSEEKIK